MSDYKCNHCGMGVTGMKCASCGKDLVHSHITKEDGSKVGVGVKRVSDSGVVLKLDYSQTDYDKVSYKTTNSTTVTGDIDNTMIALSIGKSF